MFTSSYLSRARITLALIAMAASPVIAIATEPFAIWLTPSPKPTAKNLFGVTFTNGLFVAVGANGTILSSANGMNWTARTPSAGYVTTLRAVTAGGGQFVAVGEKGSIVSSANGITWTERPQNAGYNFVDVAYGGGQFAAVGPGPQVPNGEGGGFTVNTNIILTSANGAAWLQQSAPVYNANYFLDAIAYGNGRFLINEGGQMIESLNGVNWNRITAFATDPLGKLKFAQGKFFQGNVQSIRVSSDNGLSWADEAAFSGLGVYSMANGGGYYAAVGTGFGVRYSTNATDWTTRIINVPEAWYDVAYGNGRFVAVGGLGAIRVGLLPVSLSVQRGASTVVTVRGAPGPTCTIEMTENLNSTPSWQALGTFTLTNTVNAFTDTGAVGRPQRFYRALIAP
jgi:hypothetical protein